MSKALSFLLTACLLFIPFATFADDYGSQLPQTQQRPPIAQPLVREGDFALKLADQLGLGSPDDEAQAEDLLARAGVSPANGWISDYPVTPEILGQLDESLQNSAQDGKLPVSYDNARQKVAELAQELDLPVPAPEGTETAAGTPPDASNYAYYNTVGPPIITYYPPPPAYAYMYDWVPYPAFWFGVGFSGFYICHQFTTVVTVGPAFGFHHPHRAVVTNRFFDSGHRRVIVDHEFRGTGRNIRPHTMLREDHGRTFGGFPSDQGQGAGGLHPVPRSVPPPRTHTPGGNRPFNSMPGAPHNRPPMNSGPRLTGPPSRPPIGSINRGRGPSSSGPIARQGMTGGRQYSSPAPRSFGSVRQGSGFSTMGAGRSGMGRAGGHGR